MSHKRKHSTPDRTATSAFVAADELLPRRAFSVTGAPDYTEDAPQTAEEYLRRVKWEARQQPRVFTSTIDPRRFDHLQTQGYVRTIQPLPHTSARVLPSAEWESSFASQFADIRQSFAHYSQLHPPADPQPQPPTALTTALDEDDTVTAPQNCEAWARYCLGLSSPTTPPPMPSLPTVAAFDQLTTRGVLAQIVTQLQQSVTRAQARRQWGSTVATHKQDESKGVQDEKTSAAELSSGMKVDSDEEEEEDVEEEEDERDESAVQPVVSSRPIGSVSGSTSSRSDALSILSPSTTRWLYCLLAHLQKPLPGEAEVQLRQLYRVCGSIRAEAGKLIDKSHTQHTTAERKQDEGELQRAAEIGAAEEAAMWCNMLLTIVDRIFGQRIPMQVLPAS